MTDAAVLPARPLLPGFFQVLPIGADVVQLHSAGRVIRLSGPGIAKTVPAILAALDGSSTVEQLAQRLDIDRTVIEQLVSRLAADGVVVDAAGWDDPDAVRGVEDATLEFFAELGSPPSGVRAAIASACIAVLGLGPVARVAASHLTAAGVGSLRLADDRSCEGWRETLERADLAVVELDEREKRSEAVNAACLAAGVPFLLHQVTTLGATVGPTVEPFRSACHACLVLRRRSHLRHHEEETAYREAVRDGRLVPRDAALLAGGAAIAGGLVSIEALRLVAGAGPGPTTGALLAVDFRTLEVHREEVLRLPGCPACDSVPNEVSIQP